MVSPRRMMDANIPYSLPPYKHTRNPALEKENEFYEYKSWEVPFITYDGIVERRKTTDLKLIRSQPPHPGIEFEYLSLFSQEKPLQPLMKNTIRKNGMKTGLFGSGDERVENKSTRKDNEIENTIVSESDNCVGEKGQEEDARSTRSRRSTKTSASHESLISRTSAKSVSTNTSETSTIKEILREPSGSSKLPNQKTPALVPKLRNVANGLDEDDHFPRGSR